MAQTLLATRQITKRYGSSVAVDGVSLTLQEGQIYGLVGQNGAGKTTLMRMMTGQTLPSSGELELFGETSPQGIDRMRANLGAVVETPSFFPFFTARENLEYYRRQRGIVGRGCIDDALRQVELGDTGSKKFKDFSLGMKQRLGLALALLNRPAMLLLDEPINGLDPMGIAHFRTLIQKLCEENGVTVLISSHILSELESFATCYGFTDSNLNHTGIYLYSKGKIMIHLTFDYKTDEKCTTPGQYLKYHRTFQGLSTRELAEKVGIVPATLVLYENDRHPIKYSTAVALANVLGIDRNRLLDEYTAFVDYPYFSLLKKVRQDLSLTQIQMAELIGIGQTSYSGWEREIRVPRRKEYDKILAALKKLKVNVDTYLCQSASI